MLVHIRKTRGSVKETFQSHDLTSMVRFHPSHLYTNDIILRRYRITVNTLALHAGYTGSIPVGVILLSARIVKWYNANLVNSSLWFDSICRHASDF